MPARTRILILHPHVLLRHALVELIRRHDSIEVAGDTANVDEAIDLARSLRPHVFVMDGAGHSFLEICRTLNSTCPELPIVLIGTSRDLTLIMRAFRAGGTMYLPPDIGLDDLVRCLEEAHRNGRDAGPYLARPRPANDADGSLAISRRELEVLALVAQGKANREIGRVLSISENTVRNHIANIFGKMGVRDRTEAAVQAIKRGLV